jgi:hypothetical protein
MIAEVMNNPSILTRTARHGLEKFLALALASIIVLTGCGGANTPAGAYRHFLTSIQNGDLDEAAKFVSPNAAAKLGAASMDPKIPVTIVYQATKAKGGIKSFTVDDDGGIQGNTATVKFVINFGDGTSDNGRQQLQKSADGRWQIGM